MSGGHWNYGMTLEDNDEALRRVLQGNQVLKQAEHELDWGLSGDTCTPCAKLRILAGLEQFFDDGCADASAAIALMRDYDQNICDKCQKWQAERDAIKS